MNFSIFAIKINPTRQALIGYQKIDKSPKSLQKIRAGSLARQSTGLLIPVSGVQIPSGPLLFQF